MGVFACISVAQNKCHKKWRDAIVITPPDSLFYRIISATVVFSTVLATTTTRTDITPDRFGTEPRRTTITRATTP